MICMQLYSTYSFVNFYPKLPNLQLGRKGTKKKAYAQEKLIFNVWQINDVPNQVQKRTRSNRG